MRLTNRYISRTAEQSRNPTSGFIKVLYRCMRHLLENWQQLFFEILRVYFFLFLIHYIQIGATINAGACSNTKICIKQLIDDLCFHLRCVLDARHCYNA